MKKDRFVSYEAYEKLADAYAEKTDTKPHNAFYERPATISLLPKVEGLRVLDAGCGPGALSEWLVKNGASVMGLDASPGMIRNAKKRLRDSVELRLHDLHEPLDFIEDESIDLVVSSLVMDYILDWVPVLKEFLRILVKDGYFVLTIEHPFAKFGWHNTEDYFQTEQVYDTWTDFTDEPITVSNFRRPIMDVINSFIESGFIIDRALEPQPIPEFKLHLPESYERMMKNPHFMSFRLRKPKSDCLTS